MPHTQYSTKSLHGKVSGDTYHKQVSGSVHMLRKPPAWAVALADLAEAVRMGATRVEIHDQDTAVTYSATVAKIYEHGFEFNRGYGRQIALPLQYFGTIGELHTGGISAVKSERQQPQARQYSFLEGVNHATRP